MEKLKEEVKKLTFLEIFFLICFGCILLMTKLFLEDYDVDIYIIPKILISTLVAAKVVAIVDAIPAFNRHTDSPRYIRVLYKTFIYVFAVFLLTTIEHLFHYYMLTKNLGSALTMFIDHRNMSKFFAVTLCISLVFLIHNIFQEIDNYLGKGNLVKLFFGKSNP